MIYIILILLLSASIIIILKLNSSLKREKNKNYENTVQLSKKIEDIRIFRHDLKNILFGLNTLISEGQYKKAEEYLNSLQSDFKKSDTLKIYSDNAIINAVLNKLLYNCENNGISFDASVTVGDALKLSETDICAIFSNLADNAFEAVQNQKSGEKFIAFSSSRREKWFTVTVSNSFDGIINTSADGKIITKKIDTNNHGMGLYSIRKKLESAGGVLKTEPDTEEKIFYTTLMFPR